MQELSLQNDLYAEVAHSDQTPSLMDELYGPRPVVRILIYTDSTRFSSPGGEFGTSILQSLIRNNNPFYVSFEIEHHSRNEDGHASFRLTPEVLARYDEVWFFGDYQMSLDPYTPAFGGPQNELTEDELRAVTNWMGSGGVLMTGDHANPPPPTFSFPQHSDPTPREFSGWINLGKALGHRVPRAGQLRRWDGSPSYIDNDSINTQVRTAEVTDLYSDQLQADRTPQRIMPKAYGNFLTGRHPHPLFCGRNGWIEIFPDHMHEGLLTIPSSLNDEWPEIDGVRPRPEIVAFGVNQRTGERCALVTVYDGDPVLVGRIVADSTWHHYINVNLRGFLIDGQINRPNEDLRTIANYYVNLAVWLAPREKRLRMSQRFFWQVANHPRVFEVVGSGVRNLGETAYDVLWGNASQCEVMVMIQLLRSSQSLLQPAAEHLPPVKSLLGGIIQEYHEAFAQAAHGKSPKKAEEVMRSGLKRAFAFHTDLLKQMSSEVKKTEQDWCGDDDDQKKEQ